MCVLMDATSLADESGWHPVNHMCAPLRILLLSPESFRPHGLGAPLLRIAPSRVKHPGCKAFGELAEWLRSGLQIRLRRFDSGTRLQTFQKVGGQVARKRQNTPRLGTVSRPLNTVHPVAFTAPARAPRLARDDRHLCMSQRPPAHPAGVRDNRSADSRAAAPAARARPTQGGDGAACQPLGCVTDPATLRRTKKHGGRLTRHKRENY